VTGRRLVELAVNRLLDLHPLGNGLDHDVDVAELLIGGRADDQGHHLFEAGIGRLLGELLLRDQLVELRLGDLARLLERVIDELLLDVLHHHGDVGSGDDLGDLAAHRAAAQHGGLEDKHVRSSSEGRLAGGGY
jgi:hypothetical protein